MVEPWNLSSRPEGRDVVLPGSVGFRPSSPDATSTLRAAIDEHHVCVPGLPVSGLLLRNSNGAIIYIHVVILQIKFLNCNPVLAQGSTRRMGFSGRVSVWTRLTCRILGSRQLGKLGLAACLGLRAQRRRIFKNTFRIFLCKEIGIDK